MEWSKADPCMRIVEVGVWLMELSALQSLNGLPVGDIQLNLYVGLQMSAWLVERHTNEQI